ncbi:MAG TPA: hypothetical protein VGN86_10300, partial [Pyrinomonadaceae bacterium]|nr:hypothetical protein [Pyrinomonadaceae bacterium]
MFENQESTPWYRSVAGIVGVSIVLPPLGLALVWLRKQTPLATKLLSTLAVFCLAGGYFFGYKAWRKSSGNEAVYDAVEQNRAQQRAQESNPQSAVTVAAPQPAASVAAAANGQPAPAGTTPETAAAHAGRNYWTNFRGPNRDGKYDEMPVLASWPAQGLTPLWKQPIGIGYGSFT